MDMLVAIWIIVVMSLPMIIAATFHSNPSAEVRWSALATAICLDAVALVITGKEREWDAELVVTNLAPPVVLAAVWMGLGHLRRLYKEGAEAERGTASPQE